MLIADAGAHGTEQWINDTGLTDPVSRQYCCGPSDCRVLPDNAVTEVEGGYRVIVNDNYDGVFIRSERALPASPDGHYHICANGLDVRCFITPPKLSEN